MDIGGIVRGLRGFALVGLLGASIGCGSAASAGRPAGNAPTGPARDVVKAAFAATIRAGTAKVVQQEVETSSDACRADS